MQTDAEKRTGPSLLARPGARQVNRSMARSPHDSTVTSSKRTRPVASSSTMNLKTILSASPGIGGVTTVNLRQPSRSTSHLSFKRVLQAESEYPFAFPMSTLNPGRFLLLTSSSTATHAVRR